MSKKANPVAPEDRWPKRKMGKHCGYDLNEDGSIEVAPTYSEAMAKTCDDRRVVDELLQSAFFICSHVIVDVPR